MCPLSLRACSPLGELEAGGGGGRGVRRFEGGGYRWGEGGVIGSYRYDVSAGPGGGGGRGLQQGGRRFVILTLTGKQLGGGGGGGLARCAQRNGRS